MAIVDLSEPAPSPDYTQGHRSLNTMAFALINMTKFAVKLSAASQAFVSVMKAFEQSGDPHVLEDGFVQIFNGPINNLSTPDPDSTDYFSSGNLNAPYRPIIPAYFFLSSERKKAANKQTAKKKPARSKR